MLWDIFCRVIDNHGDIGVCWRLCRQLAERGESVRLWVDDSSALDWMAPGGLSGIEVKPWEAASHAPDPGQVVVEAFGCELPLPFQAAMAQVAQCTGHAPAWLNLEYLTAERYAERHHGLPSPVLTGPAAGLTKYFFYPGFTRGTGGLLREPHLASRRHEFDRDAWFRRIGVAPAEGSRLLSLFCYEPPALGALLDLCAKAAVPTHLLVTPGRATDALRAALQRKNATDPTWLARSGLSIDWMPWLTQIDFDHLLWACDLNFVRGEDSLVRGLWAGKPLVWQLYPQDDGAHLLKLEAFMDWLGAPQDLREFHRGWNGVPTDLPLLDLQAWARPAEDALARLLTQDDLVTQLLRTVHALAGGTS